MQGRPQSEYNYLPLECHGCSRSVTSPDYRRMQCGSDSAVDMASGELSEAVEKIRHGGGELCARTLASPDAVLPGWPSGDRLRPSLAFCRLRVVLTGCRLMESQQEIS